MQYSRGQKHPGFQTLAHNSKSDPAYTVYTAYSETPVEPIYSSWGTEHIVPADLYSVYSAYGEPLVNQNEAPLGPIFLNDFNDLGGVNQSVYHRDRGILGL